MIRDDLVISFLNIFRNPRWYLMADKVISGISVTNIHDSQDIRGRGYLFNSSLPLPPTSGIYLLWGILMSVIRHKKLNSLIEFSISIFIKFYFKAFWQLKFCSKFIGLLSFLYFKLFICPSGVKRPKSFRIFTPWTLTKALLWIHCVAYST